MPYVSPPYDGGSILGKVLSNQEHDKNMIKKNFSLPLISSNLT